ncbi:heterokaryon incompatibility protein-domain-containing protein [Aspergillus carlsbadensis]|nr:heterokaryon incompatibility protein-domain-containing protein [Aspergillus carlsbadensis]
MASKPRFRDRLSRVFKSDTKPPAPAPAAGPASVPTTSTPNPKPTDRKKGEESLSATSTPIPTTPTPTSTSNNPNDRKDDDDSFPSDPILQITSNPASWSFFDFTPTNSSSLNAAGSLHYDFVVGTQAKWARGETFPRDFLGPRLFASSDARTVALNHALPKRLYDVVDRRVCDTDTAPILRSDSYVAISHVWGANVASIDGARYGVPWPIPIRSTEKLDLILDAVRILTGERYIWMDVLCLNQSDRRAREDEIAEMGNYYRHAAGCFVWLDNAYNDCDWERDILDSIKEINGFFKQDAHGTPKVSATEMFGPNGSGMGQDSYKWIRKVRRIERAPWFRRVWTLQEAVIPRDLFICTPERYMTSFSTLLQIVGMVEMLAKGLLAEGAHEAIVLFEELQQSETYKILKLRQLYEKEEISFWHLAQAVRSRTSTLEYDRVLGVSGMLQKTHPVIDSRLDAKRLWGELWEQAVVEGDFSACLYLGERPSLISMFPDTEAGMAFISTGATATPAPKETHTLRLTDDGIQMNSIGIDPVKQAINVYCQAAEGPLSDWTRSHPTFIEWSVNTHSNLAGAWGLPSDTSTFTLNGQPQEFCPAAWAVYSVLWPTLAAPVLDAFGAQFATAVRRYLPQAMIQRSRIAHVMKGDAALVLVWMASSEPQLAIVSEAVSGTVVAVTPSSYLESPGPGCLLCKVLPEGGMRKIGLGLGGAVRAGLLASDVVRPRKHGLCE